MSEYVIVVRSFAPWRRFGRLIPEVGPIGGEFHGDHRGFSTAPSEDLTSRMNYRIVLNTSTGQVSGQRAWSDISHGPLQGVGSRVYRLATPTADTRVVQDSGAQRLDIRLSGANPLMEVAPDIDIRVLITLEPSEDGRTLVVTSNLTGDLFPAAEVMLTDEAGNTVWLAGFSPTDKGVLSVGSLFGSGEDIDITSFRSRAEMTLGQAGEILRIHGDYEGRGELSAIGGACEPSSSVESWNVDLMNAVPLPVDAEGISNDPTGHLDDEPREEVNHPPGGASEHSSTSTAGGPDSEQNENAESTQRNAGPGNLPSGKVALAADLNSLSSQQESVDSEPSSSDVFLSIPDDVDISSNPIASEAGYSSIQFADDSSDSEDSVDEGDDQGTIDDGIGAGMPGGAIDSVDLASGLDDGIGQDGSISNEPGSGELTQDDGGHAFVSIPSDDHDVTDAAGPDQIAENHQSSPESADDSDISTPDNQGSPGASEPSHSEPSHSHDSAAHAPPPQPERTDRGHYGRQI